MKKFTDEELKVELSRRGYFTDNLWCVDDVKHKFIVTNEEAQDVLNKSLTNEATMEQIWYSIETFGEMGGYKKVEDDETF
jgi:methyl coenzyme M reductase alpha subunit